MTEEIIIDGVNVAGCNFRLERDNKQKCECCHATGFGVICDCEAWHNCSYKQLKRLKQENEELKADIKQYNEWLDEERESREYWCKQSLPYRKYRTALEEIRKIADKCKECLNEDDDCGCDYLRIVRKINEVLSE